MYVRCGAEQKRFGREEMRASFGDLAAFRRKRLEASDKGRRVWSKWGNGQNPAGSATAEKAVATPLRNHGLLSKAKRALEIAGWSAAAQGDAEVYRLVDPEGLTPLLTMLVEAKTGNPGEQQSPPSRREIAFEGPYNGEVRQITTQPPT